MTSTLSHFWQLASSSKPDRLGSAHALVQNLVREQSHLSTVNGKAAKRSQLLSDDGLMDLEAPEQVTDEDVQQAESSLNGSGTADVAYAVKRLIKGLASHRESSRLGFSVALSELLSHLHTISAHHILVLVLAYSTPNGKLKGQEERDLVFARLFGINALLRSGMLTSADLARQQDFQRAINVLWTINRGKPWLRESAASVIAQAIEVLEKSIAPWRLECQRWFAEKVCSDKVLTADNIAIYLALKQAAPEAFSSAQRLPHVASQELLAPANLPVLAPALRDATVEGGDETIENGATASGSAKAHFVWDMIMQQYSKKPDSKGKTAPFADTFRILVDDNYFAITASHQKKSWGFQVFEKAVKTIHTSLVHQIFMPNLMRTLINQLCGKDRMLNKTAQKACHGLQEAVRERPAIAYDVVLQLTGPLGSLRFDSMSGNKTLETILRFLTEDDIRRYCGHLVSMARTGGSDSARVSIMDQLLVVVRSVHIKSDETCIEEILNFLAAHGLFLMKGPLETADPSFTYIQDVPEPAFTSTVRAASRSRFLSCLSELHAATSTGIEGDRKVINWIERGHEIVKRLDQEAQFERLAKSNAAALGRADKIVKTLRSSIRKSRDEEQRKQSDAMMTFLTATVIYAEGTQLDDEETKELLEPLADAAERLLINPSQEEGEPGAMELFVDCLSNALQPASAFLRVVATQSFDIFAGQMTRDSMRLLIEQLGFNQQDKQASDAEEADEVAKSDEDDTMSDSMSDTSATSAQFDEVDEEDVDEDFANKIREALQSGGVADAEGIEGTEEVDEDEKSDESSSSSVESNFDDEQMLLIDDKLADIFRQKFSARKHENQAKKEEVAYHVRIVDLLDHFARQHGDNSLCVEMVLPLFTIALEKDKSLEPLRQRATTVLQKSLLKGKDWPSNVPGADVSKALDAIHKVACTNVNSTQLSLASAASTYLTRSCLHGDSEAPIEVQKVYSATLQDFIERKANNLKPQFLIDAFNRFPRLGFALRDELLAAASGPQLTSQRSFRQLQALEMLRSIVTQFVAQQLAARKDQRDALEALLRSLAALTLQRAGQDKLRIKELLKAGLHFVRVTKKWAAQLGDDALMGRIWPVEQIQSAIDALGFTNALPNSTSLQSLLKQMLALASKQHAVVDSSREARKRSSTQVEKSEKANKKGRKG